MQIPKHFMVSLLAIAVIMALAGCSSNSGNPTNPGGSSGPELSSSVFSQGQTYSHTFTKAGTFPYHCGVHPSMKASVTVLAGGSATQASVSISGFVFQDASLTVNVGSTVTWTNNDSAPHSVISD
jgi:plastocyanin